MYTLKTNERAEVDIVQYDASPGPHVFVDRLGDTMVLDADTTLGLLRIIAAMQAVAELGHIRVDDDMFIEALSLLRALRAIAEEERPGAAEAIDGMLSELRGAGLRPQRELPKGLRQ